MRLINKLIQLVWPEPLRCVYCDQVIQSWQVQFGLCGQCFGEMDFFQGEGVEEALWLKQQYFDLVHGVALYQGVVKDLLYRFKYHGERNLVHPLVELMVAQYPIAFAQEKWDGILYVPLHEEKLQQRGYNQAQLLGEGLAYFLGIPCHDWLERVKMTLPQNQLKPGERMENLLGAFRVKGDYIAGAGGWSGSDGGITVGVGTRLERDGTGKLEGDRSGGTGQISPLELLKGGAWLVVDDIFTTGTTCNELARVLKNAGAARVGVYIVASGRKM